MIWICFSKIKHIHSNIHVPKYFSIFPNVLRHQFLEYTIWLNYYNKLYKIIELLGKWKLEWFYYLPSQASTVNIPVAPQLLL